MSSTRRAARFVSTAALLSATWYLLSGKFDLLHFGTGVLTALVIAWRYPHVADCTSFRPLRFLAYVPWLMKQIIVSNLRVARMVLSPQLRIAPTLVRQPPRVQGWRALTLLGSSITLTPGTLTVDIGEDELLVHALDTSFMGDDRVVAARVASVFPAEEVK